jgi:hypothetical protein
VICRLYFNTYAKNCIQLNFINNFWSFPFEKGSNEIQGDWVPCLHKAFYFLIEFITSKCSFCLLDSTASNTALNLISPQLVNLVCNVQCMASLVSAGLADHGCSSAGVAVPEMNKWKPRLLIHSAIYSFIHLDGQ